MSAMAVVTASSNAARRRYIITLAEPARRRGQATCASSAGSQCSWPGPGSRIRAAFQAHAPSFPATTLLVPSIQRMKSSLPARFDFKGDKPGEQDCRVELSSQRFEHGKRASDCMNWA